MPTDKPTPAEIRDQAPVVGSAADGVTDDAELDAALAPLAPVLALIATPAAAVASPTGGAVIDAEARAAIDGVIAVLVDAGILEAEA